MAKKVIEKNDLSIPIFAVAKGPTRKKQEIFSVGEVPKLSKIKIAQVMDEAHRFAINYHRKLRKKEMLET